MNIRQISDEGQTLGFTRGAAPDAARAPQAGRKPAGQDRSELSAFGRLIQASAEEFQAARRPREERLQEFRDRLDEPVAWTDDVLRVVLQRLHDA
jgi:hypothetical protein